MSDTNEPADPIDEEAAHIDARAEDAPEQIAELVRHAEAMGRDVSDSPIDPDDELPSNRQS